MRTTKDLIILVSIAIVAGINIAALKKQETSNDYKNLKVLPVDIDSKTLQSIMVDDFQDGLGVGCGYCHAQEKNSMHLDYASDEKPEKEIARQMMRMTLDVNKNYFGIDTPQIGNTKMSVSCASCHRGAVRPEL
jgi:hypothetical protein